MTIPPVTSIAGSTAFGNEFTKRSSPAASAGSGADFATVLNELTQQAASTIKAGEDTAMKGLQGQAPVQDVVQAVMQAQTSLQTAQALRDKAVAAYQELIRMTI